MTPLKYRIGQLESYIGIISNSMKALLTIILSISVSTAICQCVNPNQQMIYDTTVRGFGNSTHVLTFPKFDASFGTLMEIKLQSEVTLSYSFELENTGIIPIPNYRVRVGRDDELTSSALLTPVVNTHLKNYGPYTLSAYDGLLGVGSDAHIEPKNYVMDHTVINRSLYNIADYLGTGSVNFNYSASTYSTVYGSGSYSFNGNAEDTMKVSLVYIFCPTFFLASDITTFTAGKKNNLVDIRWTNNNEIKDRKYILEKSFDGKNFHEVESFHSTPGANQVGSYQYDYIPSSAEKGKIIFRMKQVEKNGSFKYSSLRVVELTRNDGFNVRLYPNPARKDVTVLFHSHKKSDWTVDLYSINGQLLNRYQFNNALVGKLNEDGLLKKGSYVIKATHKRSGESFIQQLAIQ